MLFEVSFFVNPIIVEYLFSGWNYKPNISNYGIISAKLKENISFFFI